MPYRSSPSNLVAIALALFCARAEASDLVITQSTPRVTATFAPALEVAAPGAAVPIVVHQAIAAGWHTYWENPGDSGKEIALEWVLPAGVTAGELRFPVPEAIPFGPLMNYGYAGETALLTELAVPPDWPAGQPVNGEAHATWVVCEEICIPEGARFSFSLPTAAEPTSLEPVRALFSRARNALPVPAPWPVSVHAGDDILVLVIDAALDPKSIEGAYFFPREWGRVDHAAPQSLRSADDCITLTLARGARVPGAVLEGVLVLPGSASAGYLVSASVHETASTCAAAPGSIPNS